MKSIILNKEIQFVVHFY